MPADPSKDQNFLKVQEVDSGSAIVSTEYLKMPALPATPLSTLTEKPTTRKTATKTLTPVPAETTTQKSSPGIGAGILAIGGAALLVIRRK
jgi:hypothetical protein